MGFLWVMVYLCKTLNFGLLHGLLLSKREFPKILITKIMLNIKKRMKYFDTNNLIFKNIKLSIKKLNLLVLELKFRIKKEKKSAQPIYILTELGVQAGMATICLIGVVKIFALVVLLDGELNKFCLTAISSCSIEASKSTNLLELFCQAFVFPSFIKLLNTKKSYFGSVCWVADIHLRTN
ncbi:hypothetical protein BpHYR1_008102 [Brachionus plicatilis]|uniref:Uncharacterized protein n=1 Tax=Brachionus plicatilis TaxID=10195 RepID=A0A3M7QYG9_BRAPC|nr:hypothetical protein BpHYR1_008102 [Brachionus plicatilis]